MFCTKRLLYTTFSKRFIMIFDRHLPYEVDYVYHTKYKNFVYSTNKNSIYSTTIPTYYPLATTEFNTKTVRYRTIDDAKKQIEEIRKKGYCFKCGNVEKCEIKK